MKTDANLGSIITWKNWELDFSKKIYVMGIINITPDSFYAGSRTTELDQALKLAEAMLDAGADIIDAGGESTRPGAEATSLDEELKRVVPFIEELKKRRLVLISVDTRKRVVWEQALQAGADIVNTVGGLRDDDDFAASVGKAGVPVVLMHMRGSPKTMQENPQYKDPVKEIAAELTELIDHARAKGIAADKIIIDPGIGFGKRLEDNLAILARLSVLKALGYPLLIGVSRKSFLGAITGKPVEERLAGTVVVNAFAVSHGADIIRVHDAAEGVDVARIIGALRRYV
jgi:dihydropteroate synthase